MEAFAEAAALLPPQIRRRADALPAAVRQAAEELRLRAGRSPSVTVRGEEMPFPGDALVSIEDLTRTLEISTRASAQTALDKLRRGWFTVPGGHRVGLCGEVAMSGGEIKSLRTLSSLNIRIARPVPGCAEAVFRQLKAETFPNTLILAPPGAGKTTLLRDLIRLVSQAAGPIGVCDERGEIAALRNGKPQFDVGVHTDVLDGCPKAEGLLMLLRGMRPRFLACDEITDPADAAALRRCIGCGVGLLATAHGGRIEDLSRRDVYIEIASLFDAVVLIACHKGCRSYRVEMLPC